MLLHVGHSIYVVILVYGAFVSGTMALLQWWYRHNRRVHHEEIERMLAFARAEVPERGA